ncbi:hypothetical protein [Paenibacillus azoreducens]|uniref:Uncharacterized protein n=1 Tax=Paenibacillus azoreducens TaxID=116718 RepID=A0A919YMN2_9BACL|nr:hypothetical protein [Paenibacillus azoreducens]GIO51037.1 hypothetical protein J34TS1_58020 [Paenibacillus azoreducens]
MKTASKVAVVALSSILLLGSSVNFAVEAAPNKSANAAAEKKPQAENKGEQLQKAEIDRISKLLEANPDDSYMVFVSNELTKRKGMETFAMGNTMPEYTSYEDYWKKASTLTEPAPKQPEGLPEGYSFAGAKIVGPYSGDYDKEMKAEAKKLGKQIYSKKINWTTTNFIQLEYKNGDDYILISSTRLDPQSKRHKGYVYESAEETRKKNPKLEEEFVTNSVVWTENNKGLAIQTNPGNPITKEELIKLAKTASKK